MGKKVNCKDLRMKGVERMVDDRVHLQRGCLLYFLQVEGWGFLSYLLGI